MEKTQITPFGAAVFVAAVAATIRETDPQSAESSENPLLELLNAHLNAFVDGTSPLHLHRSLSPVDQATVMALQKFLNDSVKDGLFDFLIP